MARAAVDITSEVLMRTGRSSSNPSAYSTPATNRPSHVDSRNARTEGPSSSATTRGGWPEPTSIRTRSTRPISRPSRSTTCLSLMSLARSTSPSHQLQRNDDDGEYRPDDRQQRQQDVAH